jgi:hypothetical protein
MSLNSTTAVKAGVSRACVVRQNANIPTDVCVCVCVCAFELVWVKKRNLNGTPLSHHG